MKINATGAALLSEKSRVIGVHLETIEHLIMATAARGETVLKACISGLTEAEELSAVVAVLEFNGFSVLEKQPFSPAPRIGESTKAPGHLLTISWGKEKSNDR